MKNECSRVDLLHGLRGLGVRRGMMLEVHSSLSSLGHVPGGAKTVIEALMHIVGKEGAIVMPSFKISRPVPLDAEDEKMGLTVKLRVLNGDENKSGMGLIADAFRDRADVVTGEGMFRVSAWGKDAKKHSEGLSHLIENGGQALMLGVDIYRLSAMHTVEDALPDAIKERFAPPEAIWEKYDKDKWFIEAWSPPERPWYKIQDSAYERGYIKDGKIGQAHCMLMEVKPVVGLYRRALEDDAYGLYGVNKTIL